VCCWCISYTHAQTLKTVDYEDPPLLGQTLSVNPSNPSHVVKSEDVFFGSFSGLVFLGITPEGEHSFLATMDRGPTGGNIKDVVLVGKKKENGKAFVLPDYNPKLFEIHVNFDTGRISVVHVINLTKSDGETPLTGRPNLQYDEQNLAYTDAYPVDLFGNLLENDPLGADIEGIAIADDGSYWAGDEYRPSIYHFDEEGRLLDRFIPLGYPTDGGDYGTPVLPAVYAKRQENRGFEAVAIEGDLLYAFIQSPIDNPNSKKNVVGQTSRNIRILAFNITTHTVDAEYVYLLTDQYEDKKNVDKISDATSLGNGRFLVVERDASDKKKSYKYVFEVDVSEATDIHKPENLRSIPDGLTLEQVDITSTDIIPVKKTEIVNLMSLGWPADNVEGLTVIDRTTIAVVSDNDFQLDSSEDPIGDGTVFFDRNKFTVFGKVSDLRFATS